MILFKSHQHLVKLTDKVLCFVVSCTQLSQPLMQPVVSVTSPSCKLLLTLRLLVWILWSEGEKTFPRWQFSLKKHTSKFAPEVFLHCKMCCACFTWKCPCLECHLLHASPASRPCGPAVRPPLHLFTGFRHPESLSFLPGAEGNVSHRWLQQSRYTDVTVGCSQIFFSL